MKIHDFPLAWRWTSRNHSILPDTVLEQLQPLGEAEARAAFDREKLFPQGGGVRESADISRQQGCEWMQARHADLADTVTICWSSQIALRTTWRIFTEHWDAFCYPNSDDVAVWPDSERWVLYYRHEEWFEFIESLGT